MKEIKAKQLREMSNEEIVKKLKDMQNELLIERGSSSLGGAPHNPGKVKSLRRQISRIKTVLKEKGVRV